MLFNVRGLKELNSTVWRSNKLHTIKSIAKRYSDITAFTETHLSKEDVPRTKKMLGHDEHAAFTEGESSRSGVGIVSWRRWATIQVLETWGDRAMAVQVDCRGAPLKILILYFPCEDKKQVSFVHEVMIPAMQTQEFDLILADWNHVQDPVHDQSSNFKLKYKKAARLCQEELEKAGFVDMWRLAGIGDGFTYFTPGSSGKKRLDRGYKGPGTRVAVSKVTVLPRVDPFDHAPVIFKLRLKHGKQKGPGLWRPNPNAFQDEAVLEELRALWFDVKNLGWSPKDTMEAMRLASITYLKATTMRQPSAIWSTVMDELSAAELAGEEDKVTEELHEQLSAHLQEHADWARAAFNMNKDLFEGLPTKMLTSVLKGRRAQADFTAVRVGSTLLTTQEQMEKAIHSKWSAIYQKQDISPRDQIKYLSQWQPPDGLFTGFETPFTEEEFKVVVHKASARKAPCANDLGNAFLKALPEIWPTLLQLINECWLGRESLPSNWRSGVVVLLYKGKGDPTDLDNRRPITLLQTWYKTYTGLINNRLQPILNKICRPTLQHGFIRGRRIINNILNVHEAALAAGKYTVSTLEDETKAFDSLNHSFIVGCYARAGCPEGPLAAIHDIYSQRTARILINGFSTAPVNLDQGAPQGCCLSPSTFALSIEPLLVDIVDDQTIKGTKLKAGIELKVQAFADDTITESSEKKDLILQLQAFQRWAAVSGVQLNPSKTVMLSNSKLTPVQGIQQLPKNHDVKYLGLSRGNYGFKDKREQLMQQLESDLARWSAHTLPLRTKVAVVKTYALSKLWYHSSLTVFNDKDIERMDRSIRKFLACRPGQTPLSLPSVERLVPPRHQGGVKLTNLAARFSARAASRAAEMLHQDQPWKLNWMFLINEKAVKLRTDLDWWDWEEDQLTWPSRPVMSQALQEFSRILRRGIDPRVLTPSEIYWELAKVEGPILSKSQREAEEELGVSYRQIWQRFAELTSVHYVHTTMFRFLHRLLPIQSKKMMKCKCGGYEGHEHTICQCPLHSAPVVNVLKAMWMAKTNIPLTWDFKTVINIGPADSLPEKELIVCSVWLIWINRNTSVHENYTFSQQQIRNTLTRHYVRAGNKAIGRKVNETLQTQERDSWLIPGYVKAVNASIEAVLWDPGG